MPLIVRDRVIGVMDLESVHIGFFTEDHVRALSLLAPQIGTSVENARLYAELAQREQRMEEDLRAASKLQSVLLPRTFSDVIGLNAAIQSRPAREISGDIYDLFEHSEHYSLIAFGDVSGKGAAAALFGALISGLLRILAPRRRSPATLMKLLNEALLERKVDAQYATLCLAQWDAPNRTLTICNAGALPPLICRSGKIIETRAEGVPIGLLEDREYEEVPMVLEANDLLLFYSDGVEDQLSEHDEYGRARLEDLIASSCGKTPEEIARRFSTIWTNFAAPPRSPTTRPSLRCGCCKDSSSHVSGQRFQLSRGHSHVRRTRLRIHCGSARDTRVRLLAPGNRQPLSRLQGCFDRHSASGLLRGEGQLEFSRSLRIGA